jgi:hypothetical protein
MNKGSGNTDQSITVKIKMITEMQSIPEEIALGFVNSKGKLSLLKNGKLVIVKKKK